jgi:hypothetical protein
MKTGYRSKYETSPSTYYYKLKMASIGLKNMGKMYTESMTVPAKVKTEKY